MFKKKIQYFDMQDIRCNEFVARKNRLIGCWDGLKLFRSAFNRKMDINIGTIIFYMLIIVSSKTNLTLKTCDMLWFFVWNIAGHSFLLCPISDRPVYSGHVLFGLKYDVQLTKARDIVFTVKIRRLSENKYTTVLTENNFIKCKVIHLSNSSVESLNKKKQNL